MRILIGEENVKYFESLKHGDSITLSVCLTSEFGKRLLLDLIFLFKRKDIKLSLDTAEPTTHFLFIPICGKYGGKTLIVKDRCSVTWWDSVRKEISPILNREETSVGELWPGEYPDHLTLFEKPQGEAEDFPTEYLHTFGL